jgi:hypothetical protein
MLYRKNRTSQGLLTALQHMARDCHIRKICVPCRPEKRGMRVRFNPHLAAVEISEAAVASLLYRLQSLREEA